MGLLLAGGAPSAKAHHPYLLVDRQEQLPSEESVRTELADLHKRILGLFDKLDVGDLHVLTELDDHARRAVGRYIEKKTQSTYENAERAMQALREFADTRTYKHWNSL